MRIKSDDVDYIYVDTSELTFRIVLNDDRGEDLVVHSNNIDLSRLAIDDLCDDVKNHIDKGKPLQVVNDSIISFEADTNLEE
jgi:predicted nucleic acid-binding protein